MNSAADFLNHSTEIQSNLHELQVVHELRVSRLPQHRHRQGC
jgi:hypothetical protein